MKNSLTILVRRPPYGQIHAAEAIRHLGGALGMGIQTNILLVDDGVYVACDGQHSGETGFTSLVDPLLKAIARGARVYLHIPSAQVRGLLENTQLISGIDCIDDNGFVRVLTESEMVMVY